jgi:hypothetical protein
MAMPLNGAAGALLLGTILAAAGLAYGQESTAPIPTAQLISTPSTWGEMGNQYINELINPISVVESAASAGFGQWRDRPREWRQGAAGYGRRFASSFAQHATQETLKFGLAKLLHEDDRYFPSGQTKFASRLLYALESTFQSRDQNGFRQVSYSNLGSLVGASMISRTWQPKSTGGAGNGAVNFGISIIFAAARNVGHEFLHR